MDIPPLGDGGQLPPKFRRIFGGAKLRPQPGETLDILLKKSAYNSNFNKLHVPRGMLCPLLPGTPQVTPPKILSAGTPMKTHHKIKDFATGSPMKPHHKIKDFARFCDGVPVVHFGVPGQKFIIFDWGKFREPHSGFPPPLRRSTCLPNATALRAAAHLSYGCSLYPTKNTFGGDPDFTPPKCFRRGPRFYPTQNPCGFSAGTPKIGFMVLSRQYSDEERERRTDRGRAVYLLYISGRVDASDKVIRRIARPQRKRFM